MDGIKKATEAAQKNSDNATREREKTAHEIKHIQEDIYKLNQTLEKKREEKSHYNQLHEFLESISPQEWKDQSILKREIKLEELKQHYISSRLEEFDLEFSPTKIKREINLTNFPLKTDKDSEESVSSHNKDLFTDRSAKNT